MYNVKKNSNSYDRLPLLIKTTWVKEYLNKKSNDIDKNDWFIISRDIIRKNFFYLNYEINDENESLVTSIFKCIISSVKGKKNIIIDNMNITKASLAQIIGLIALDYDIFFKPMPLETVNTYKERNINRFKEEGKFIDEKSLLEKIDMYRNLLNSDYYEEIIIPRKLKEK